MEFNFATMPVYPKKVTEILRRRLFVDDINANVSGRAASFDCGSLIEFSLNITDGVCQGGIFRTNGCGYMAACAEILVDKLQGGELRQLHGLDDGELLGIVESRIGEIGVRRQCVEVCFAALHKTFEAHREHVAAEFTGETVLICSCFGIGEDLIVSSIKENGYSTVEQVSAELMAGRGCGSCRGLIDELIDGVRAQTM